MTSATKYGADWGNPRQAANVLRARATRFGLVVGDVSDVDAAAAALGAEAWMRAVGADSLDVPGRHGDSATRALAAILQRAAGCGDLGPVDTVAADADDSHLAAAADWVRQLELWGTPVTGVYLRVAYDLAAGGDDPRLASMAAALSAVAEAVELPVSSAPLTH